MRNDILTWKRFNVAFGVTFVLLAILNAFQMSLSVRLIVSCLALVICLIVCLVWLRPVKASGNELAKTVLITDTASNIEINYNIPGVNMNDVDFALKELEAWKERNGFVFDVSHIHSKLLVYLTDETKKKVNIVSLTGDCSNVLEYLGKFTFYTQNNVRYYKIDDIQLGTLDVSLFNPEDYVNHNCYLKIRDDKVIFIQIKGD